MYPIFNLSSSVLKYKVLILNTKLINKYFLGIRAFRYWHFLKILYKVQRKYVGYSVTKKYKKCKNTGFFIVIIIGNMFQFGRNYILGNQG